MKEKSLIKNALFNLIYNMLNSAFPLISYIYVSRVLLNDGVGKVAYAQNIVSYFVTFAALGLPTYGIREISKARKSDSLTNRVFSELFVINAISTTVAIVGYFVMIFVLNGFEDKRNLLICCGVTLLFSYINIDWFYQGQEEYVYIACRSIIIKMAFTFALFLFIKKEEDYIKYALITCLSVCANYVFNIIHARKFVRLELKGISLRPHMESLFILAISVLLSGIYSKIDITMLGMMTSDADVGCYANAHRTVELIITGIVAITGTFFPRLIYYYSSDRQEFDRLLNWGVKIITFISIPAAAGLFLLAPYLVPLLYGDSFYGAIITVRIFSVLLLIKSFGNLLCYQLIICTGNERDRLPAYAMAAAANILLNALLIPIWRQNGAAVASVVSEMVVNAYQFVKMKKFVGIHIDNRAVRQAGVSTGVMGILIVLLCQLNLSDLMRTILSVFLGFLCYIAVNLILKNDILISFIEKIKR